MGLLKSIGGAFKTITKPITSMFSSLPSGISTGIGTALGGLPGALIGGALDLGSKYIGNKLIGKPNAEDAYGQSQAASALAFKRSKDLYANRYSITVNDMKKAGLNPILAASGGFNVGNSPQMSQAQAFKADVPDFSASSSAKNVSESVLADERTKNTFHDSVKKVAEARHELIKIAETRRKTNVLQKTEGLIIEQAAHLTSQIAKNHIEIQKAQAMTKLTEAQEKEVLQKIKIVKLQASQLQKQLIELTKQSNLYKGPIGQLLSGIKETFDALNISFHIVGGL